MPCTLPACSCLVYILLLKSTAVHGKLVNVTIDDQSPSLFYSDLWEVGGSSCPSCVAAPNASQAIYGTWHDSTHYADNETNPYPTPNVSASFNGTAIYAICILSRAAAWSSDMSFYIDGDFVGEFVKTPPGELGYDNNYTNGRVGAPLRTLTLFDAIVYSYDDGQLDHNNSDIGTTTTDTSTVSPNTGFIVGLALAGALAMFWGVIAFILYRRQRRHSLEPNHSHPPITPFFLADPHIQTAAVSSISNPSNCRPNPDTRRQDHCTTLSPRRLDIDLSCTREAPPLYEPMAD